MSGVSFLQGAMVLLLAGLVNRVLGFFYQIAIIRLIGPEGVGLFNMVFPVYIMVLVLATAGIPLAIAKLVAEEVARNNLDHANRIFKFSVWVILCTSLFFTVILIIGAPLLKAHVFPNPKSYNCFISLIPGIMVVSLCSAFRGYFQGLQQMGPTAITQTVEQTVRVFAGLLIAGMLLPAGIEYAAIGLSAGVVLGELTGFLYMLRIYSLRRPAFLKRLPRKFAGIAHYRKLMSRILNLAIPVTLTRLVATGLMSVEAVLIPKRLIVAGLTMQQATAAYGQFIGIAEALLLIPGVVTMALATSLVPAISDAMAVNNLRLVRARTWEAVRITLQVGMPAAFIFLMLADELCGALFGYAQAGIILLMLAPAGPFLYLQQTTTGILQGMGRADIPFKNLVVSSLVAITGIYYLTAHPQLGIKGAAMAVAAGMVTMSTMNLIHLYNLAGFAIGFQHNVVKPLLSSLGMALIIYYLKGILYSYGVNVGVVLCLCLITGGSAYLWLMLLTGGITSQDKEKFKAMINIKLR